MAQTRRLCGGRETDDSVMRRSETGYRWLILLSLPAYSISHMSQCKEWDFTDGCGNIGHVGALPLCLWWGYQWIMGYS